MISTSFKNQIVALLLCTLVGDSQSLKKTSEYLAKASKKRGFCMAMMEIVDDVSYRVELKQAALIQLKNTIKNRWVNEEQHFDNTQKQFIRIGLFLAIMRCHGNHNLIKLYKEVVTIIVGYDYRIWLPVMQIVQILQEERGTTTVLHILLAIADSFKFYKTLEQRQYFFQFLKIVLPALQNLLQRRPQPELTYLSIKFLYKATHCQLCPELKQIMYNWIGLLTAIVGSTHPKFDNHPEDFQARETEEFYYFHSKKWATRILLRFIETHASSQVLNKQDNKLFSEQWYSAYGASLIDALIKQFSIPTSKKVRYYQLKCVHALIIQKPEVMKNYPEIFQYQILLDYLGLQPQDYQLAMKEPLQFIFEEEQSSKSNTNLRKVATDAWVAFASLGSKDVENTQSSQPGMFLIASMNYLQSKLEDMYNYREKEIAMYLLCKLGQSFMKYEQIRCKFPKLLAYYILPKLTDQVMFQRARALDIFSQFDSIKLEGYQVKRAIEGIYACLTKDVSPLVRIKAARAFSSILKQLIAKSLVRPILRDVLNVYLQLLDTYESQIICESLLSIVQNFAKEIGALSVGLVKSLTKFLERFFYKDRQSEKQEYENYAQKAAASYLSTIKTIISSSIPSECVTEIEADVVAIIYYTMLNQEPKLMQLALDVLNAFLLKVEQVSSQIWFFYPVIVYNIVGIPKAMGFNIQQLAMPQKHKHIMMNIRSGGNIEMMEKSIHVLKNYIQQSKVNTEPDHEAIKANIIQLLFYLIGQIYIRPLCNFKGEYQFKCCTHLLTCLLQNYKQRLPQKAFTYIYEYIKINTTKLKTKTLKVQTSQLIGLLLWAAPRLVVTLAQRDGLLGIFLRQLVSYEYNDRLQRARVILGISSLLMLLNQKSPALNQYLFPIFKTGVFLVQKSAQQKLGHGQNKVKGKKSAPFGKDEDEEVFRQIEDLDKYKSPLYQTIQIQQFERMMTIISYQNEQRAMYFQLLKTVGPKNWAVFREKITKAIGITTSRSFYWPA